MNLGEFVSLKGMNKRNTEEPKAKPWGKAVFVGFIVFWFVALPLSLASGIVAVLLGIIIGIIAMFIVLLSLKLEDILLANDFFVRTFFRGVLG